MTKKNPRIVILPRNSSVQKCWRWRLLPEMSNKQIWPKNLIQYLHIECSHSIFEQLISSLWYYRLDVKTRMKSGMNLVLILKFLSTHLVLLDPIVYSHRSEIIYILTIRCQPDEDRELGSSQGLFLKFILATVTSGLNSSEINLYLDFWKDALW